MRKLAVALFAVAACGGGSATPDAAIVHVIDARAIDAAPPVDVLQPDARQFDFSCSANTAPTTGAANVTLSGTVTEVGISGMTPTMTPLADATVDACKGDCLAANKLGTMATNASGAFSIGPLATGGTPLNGYLTMTHTGDRTVQVYPAEPVRADLVGIPVLTFTPALLGLLAQFGGFTQDPAKGMLIIAVTDCTDQRITDSAGIALLVKQGGTDVAGTTTIDLSPAGQMAAGLFLVGNVPVGAATSVGATYGGHTLLAHDVGVTAGTTTQTIVRPGYSN